MIQETISDSSTWYLHLLSHNPNQESGGTAHIQVSAGSAYVFADLNNSQRMNQRPHVTRPFGENLRSSSFCVFCVFGGNYRFVGCGCSEAG